MNYLQSDYWYPIVNPDKITVYPSLAPSNSAVNVKLEADITNNFEVQVFSSQGQKLSVEYFTQQSFASINMPYSAGIYYIITIYVDYLGDKIKDTKKVMLF